MTQMCSSTLLTVPSNALPRIDVNKNYAESQLKSLPADLLTIIDGIPDRPIKGDGKSVEDDYNAFAKAAENAPKCQLADDNNPANTSLRILYKDDIDQTVNLYCEDGGTVMSKFNFANNSGFFENERVIIRKSIPPDIARSLLFYSSKSFFEQRMLIWYMYEPFKSIMP